MKVFTRYLAILLFALGATGCSQQDETPLRLGTNVWPGYEPLYLAENMGWLPQPVQLVELVDASQVIQAFRNRALDAAALTLDEVLLLEQDGIPVRVVAVLDVSDGADVILARGDIDGFAGLKGRAIAVESSALGAYVLSRALEINGMTIDDVQVVHRGVDSHEEAYLSGEVDAVVNFEPVRSRLLAKGARELFSSREIPGEVVDVLVVHEDYIKAHGERVQGLIDGWFDALAMLRDDRAAAMTAMAQQGRLGESPEEIEAQYDGLKLPDRAENLAMLGEGGSLHQTVNRLSRNMLQQKLLHRAPQRPLADPRFVR